MKTSLNRLSLFALLLLTLVANIACDTAATAAPEPLSLIATATPQPPSAPTIAISVTDKSGIDQLAYEQSTDEIPVNAMIEEETTSADPTLTPTPAAINQTPSLLITGDYVNIRHGPSTDYPVVDVAVGGSEMPAIGRTPDNAWWVIPMPGRTAPGWITGLYTELTGDANDLPIVDAPAGNVFTRTPVPIQFAPGTSSMTDTNQMPAYVRAPYTFWAQAGQVIDLSLTNAAADATNPALNYELAYADDALVVKGFEQPNEPLYAVLPATGNYLLTIDGGADSYHYTLFLGIDNQPTVEPTATPAPIFDGEAIVETDVQAARPITDLLTLRSGPGYDYPVVGQLNANFFFLVDGISADNNWYVYLCTEAPADSNCEPYWAAVADTVPSRRPVGLPHTADVIDNGVEAVSAIGEFVMIYSGFGFNDTVAGQMAGGFPIPVRGITEDGRWYRTSCEFAPPEAGCEENWVKSAEVTPTELPISAPRLETVIETSVTAVHGNGNLLNIYSSTGYIYEIIGQLDSQFPVPIAGITADGDWYLSSCEFAPADADCEPYWVMTQDVTPTTLP